MTTLPKSLEEALVVIEKERREHKRRIADEIHKLLSSVHGETGWNRPLIRVIARDAVRTWDKQKRRPNDV